jgi:hypothetical protein
MIFEAITDRGTKAYIEAVSYEEALMIFRKKMQSADLKTLSLCEGVLIFTKEGDE